MHGSHPPQPSSIARAKHECSRQVALRGWRLCIMPRHDVRVERTVTALLR